MSFTVFSQPHSMQLSALMSQCWMPRLRNSQTPFNNPFQISSSFRVFAAASPPGNLSK